MKCVDEIVADPVLRIYGAVLSALHVLFAWWILHDGHLLLLAPGADPVCWPLVPFCESLRIFPLPVLTAIVQMHAALALAATALFARPRTAPAAMRLLALLVAVEIGILSLDFRLRRNQHYMALATTLTFLALPGRRDTLRVLIVLFYVWAGALKLDVEWLSGAALYRPLWLFTGRGIPAACIYVVAMELVLVWGLLARRAGWFWSALAQVLVFHVFSWGIVGYFYPVLMFGILSIFPLCRIRPLPAAATSSLLRDFLTARAARPVYVAAALFSVLQAVPHLYPGDTALTGEGRLYGLNMFDARVECETVAKVTLADGRQRIQPLALSRETRTRCDPLVARAGALALCRSGRVGRTAIRRLDLLVRGRRSSDPEMHTVVDVQDFCANPPAYDPFFHNAWIVPVLRDEDQASRAWGRDLLRNSQ